MSNASYDGDDEGLNVAWTSDLGDVEYATDPDEAQGDVSFDFLPDDIDAEDLTESQRNILATAAIRDPDSFAELAEMVGDTSSEWCRQTLNTKAPSLADDVRMSPSEQGAHRHAPAEDANPIPSDDTTEDQDDEPDEFVPMDEHDQQRRVDDAILQCQTLEMVHQVDSELARAAREIRRTLEGER